MDSVSCNGDDSACLMTQRRMEGWRHCWPAIPRRYAETAPNSRWLAASHKRPFSGRSVNPRSETARSSYSCVLMSLSIISLQFGVLAERRLMPTQRTEQAYARDWGAASSTGIMRKSSRNRICTQDQSCSVPRPQDASQCESVDTQFYHSVIHVTFLGEEAHVVQL